MISMLSFSREYVRLFVVDFYEEAKLQLGSIENVSRAKSLQGLLASQLTQVANADRDVSIFNPDH